MKRKIDLHIHTIKTKNGDGVNRDITSENFKCKMEENNIGICAITNHNIFNLKHYEEFSSEKFILLPGIELDVKVENFRKQMNIIYPPNKKEEFNEKCEKLVVTSESPLNLKEAIEIFDNDEAIFLLDSKIHSKDNKWWTIDEIKDLMNRVKALVIADVNNSRTLMVLNASNCEAIIGSDVDDWDKYGDISEKLLSTSLDISDYSRFYKIIKFDKNSLRTILSHRPSTLFDKISIEIDNNKRINIEELKLYNGVNVIFGNKATGKSKIINYLYSAKKANSILYKSSEATKLFEDIKEDSSPDCFDDLIKGYMNLVEQIKNYKEEQFTDFHSIYISLSNKSTINFHINQSNEMAIKPSQTLIEDIHKLREGIVSSCRNININNANLNSKEEYVTISKKLLDELWKIFSKENLPSWRYAFLDKLHKEISDIIKKHQGRFSMPNSIGLTEHYEKRTGFIKLIDQIKSFNKENEKEIKNLSIEDRGNISIIKKINFLEIGSVQEKFVLAKKNRIITNLANFNKLISNLKYEFDSEKIINFFSDITNYHFTNIIIQDESGKTEFSDGEKANIVLSYLLQEDKDFYFLDEPDVYLGQKAISSFLLPKISELVMQEKTVLIATHSAAVAINTIPIQYIHRKLEKNNEYKTYTGSIWLNNFKNINRDETLSFFETIIDNFEGGNKYFNFRKEIYEGQPK